MGESGSDHADGIRQRQLQSHRNGDNPNERGLRGKRLGKIQNAYEEKRHVQGPHPVCRGGSSAARLRRFGSSGGGGRPSSPAPAATPAPSAPAKGEFDNSCAMGLAEGQTLRTRLLGEFDRAQTARSTASRRRTRKRPSSKNAEANIRKRKTSWRRGGRGGERQRAKNFTEEDVNAAVKTAIDGRSKDGAFVFHDPKLNADLNLIYEQIKIVRGMEGYGWFANTIFHDKDNPKKQYAIDFWFKPEGQASIDGHPRAEGAEAGRRQLDS